MAALADRMTMPKLVLLKRETSRPKSFVHIKTIYTNKNKHVKGRKVRVMKHQASRLTGVTRLVTGPAMAGHGMPWHAHLKLGMLSFTHPNSLRTLEDRATCSITLLCCTETMHAVFLCH